jgi:hypothetical protein
MFAGNLLDEIGFVQAVEQNWLKAFALKKFPLLFTSDEYRDWILGEVKLRLKKLSQDCTSAVRSISNILE